MLTIHLKCQGKFSLHLGGCLSKARECVRVLGDFVTYTDSLKSVETRRISYPISLVILLPAEGVRVLFSGVTSPGRFSSSSGENLGSDHFFGNLVRNRVSYLVKVKKTMEEKKMARITLDDGRVFPIGPSGEPLSWDIGTYNTINQARQGYPKVLCILREMGIWSLRILRNEYLRASSDRMFGQNARPLLELVSQEFNLRSSAMNSDY